MYSLFFKLFNASIKVLNIILRRRLSFSLNVKLFTFKAHLPKKLSSLFRIRSVLIPKKEVKMFSIFFHHSFLIMLSFPALSPYIRFPQLASPTLPRLLRKRIYSDKSEWMEKDIRIIQKWMNETAHGCLTFWMISFSNLYDVLASLLSLEKAQGKRGLSENIWRQPAAHV